MDCRSNNETFSKQQSRRESNKYGHVHAMNPFSDEAMTHNTLQVKLSTPPHLTKPTYICQTMHCVSTTTEKPHDHHYPDQSSQTDR